MNIMEIKNLCSGYGSITVLHEISINIKKGEIVSIVGPNGAGKTALLRSISGLITPF